MSLEEGGYSLDKVIKESAEYLVGRFKALDYVVQYYESKTTNSIYLKLDYGVAGSVRLSDHIGKTKLRYTYNVMDGIRDREVYLDRGVQRYFYGFKHLDMLVADVEANKAGKIDTFSSYKYKDDMERNRLRGEDSRGFWKKCVLR